MLKLENIPLGLVFCMVMEFIAVSSPIHILAVSSTVSLADSEVNGKGLKYVVKNGDTLWGIADKYYGSGISWDTIASKNNIHDPQSLSSGVALIIPPSTGVNNTFISDDLSTQFNRSLLADNDSNVSISDAVYADLAVRGYLDNVSIYAFDGNYQDTVAINQDRHWLPASTVKTFVAMFAYNQISKNRLNQYDSVLIEAKNVVPTELATDELPTLEEGQYITIDRLIKQMITQSDNTAYNVLLDVLNRQKVTDYIHSLGLIHSSVGSKLNLDSSQEQYEFDAPGYGFNTTTAQEYSRAFVLIKNMKIPGAKELFAVLSQQKINNMIPLLLPKNIVIAHKHGDLDPLYHDGGIIVAPTGPYVLSIFTNLGDPNIVAHISELVYTKNLSLVGSPIQKAIAEFDNSDKPFGQIVLNKASSTGYAVLGASTIANLDIPKITAADLGIKASDLSLSFNTIQLPKVSIPADSPMHFLIRINQFLQKGLIFPSWIQDDVENIKLQLAEVKELINRGKYQQGNAILENIQMQLNQIAKDKSIISDPELQAALQSISETRFSILGDELMKLNKSERNKLIKTIALQARSTLVNIQPFIPKAENSTNPFQEPLIGELIKTKNNEVIVRTAGGQQIIIPDNLVIKIRSRGQTTSIRQKISSIPIGTTVAFIGSFDKDKFIPSFVLTNLQKQVAAPQPVVVLKVNIKNSTLVISENGIPIQVNVTNQTIIKGRDTEVSLKSIQAGDIVVVHGEIINSSKVIKKSVISPQIIPFNGNDSSKNTTNAEKAKSNSQQQSDQGNNNSQTSITNSSNSSSASQSQSATQISQPTVIQSTTVEIVEKKQGEKSNPQPLPKEEKNKK